MGDSYAAGVGTSNYFQSSGSCRRSPIAYPVLVAARLGTPLDFTACAGARISDLEADQLWPLGPETEWVTITIGGNDAGFGKLVASCALPWPWSCRDDVETARAYVHAELPARLDELFASIAVRAPGARVAVVGYPRAFDGEDCDPATFFSGAEQRMLNHTANLLARTERSLALAHGFLFVDPRRAFAGHAICDPIPWIHGLSFPVVESYHPNAAGFQAYARLVLAALRSSAWDR